MRLSKRGWNNVLIFGVLIIVFLFNFSHKLLLKPKVHERTLISNDVLIVEIKTPDFSIKRVGRGWISEPNLGLSEHQLSLLVQNWQNLPLSTQSAITPPESSFIMQVYTANEVQPIIVHLIQQGDNYLLQTDQTMSLFLSSEQLPLFLGR
ncbi:hypothetical protein CW745_14455 [Psychromonas sp. psych-6C06]|uniref:hypothetical protein n=1 Tax=Psychromonas sp. psych-6C06 TaxID=2058089 RepID=UPI000C334993|nr:hypothetical protein [Psychromonas sp. psych-6C06]PKF60537.1 hypothetical protein CW745_14455 [Psychromonas sp. psych-6C06]